MIRFGALSDLVENGRALTIDRALFFVFSDDQVQDFVLELNTGGGIFARGIKGQLFSGVDSTGNELADIGGDYSPITIQEKQFKGLPTDRVTLFDEGDFYNTFRIDVSKDSISILANTIKEGVDLQNRWGDELLGLTDESRSKLINEIIPIIIAYIKEQLLR